MQLIISKSAKLYQERKCHRETGRRPIPRLQPDAMAIHQYQGIQPPLPFPGFMKVTLGKCPPDRGRTQLWPYGDEHG